MNNLKSETLIILSITFSSILIAIAIYIRFDIEILESIFSIIGSVSIFIAALTYTYNKKRNKKIAAVEQITFFRDSIIPAYDGYMHYVKSKKPDYKIEKLKIKFNSLLLKEILSSENEIILQKDLMDILNKNDDLDLDKRPISILNQLEEMSLKLINLDAVNEDALVCIKNSFVEIIQVIALQLWWLKETNPGTYIGLLEIYTKWKDDVRYVDKSLIAKSFLNELNKITKK